MWTVRCTKTEILNTCSPAGVQCVACVQLCSPLKKRAALHRLFKVLFSVFLVSVYFFYAAAEAEAYSSTLHLIK